MILFFLATIPLYLYLALRLASHWSHWVILGIVFLGVISFPFRKLFKFQLHLSYTSMGILSFLLLFTFLRDVIYLTTQKLFSPIYVLELTFISLFIGFLNAVRGPRIKRVNIPIQHLPDELVGFKISQISDLHIGATIRFPYVNKVVEKVNKLEPDLIVLTGDIGDGQVKKYREDISPLSKLKSRHGSFFTTGNHEYYWNANEWLSVMNNLGIINLINRGKVIDHNTRKVLVAGVPDPVSRLMPDLMGMQESESASSADFKILLSHRPGIANEASMCGYHLQLSGHTHGGQFFPWTIVVKFVHKMSNGLHRVNKMWLYVNPGTGSWGPLIRLGTTPEITLLTLTQSKSDKELLT